MSNIGTHDTQRIVNVLMLMTNITNTITLTTSVLLNHLVGHVAVGVVKVIIQQQLLVK
jgi:hypothetical protein